MLLKKQAQNTHFDQAHGTRELPELGPGQEVLFMCPADDEYIPGTIIDKATEPHSYILEAQGIWFCRTREHIRPIHLNIPAPKQQPPKPNVYRPLPSCIPKPNSNLKSVSHPKKYLPQPSLHPPVASPSPHIFPSPQLMLPPV